MRYTKHLLILCCARMHTEHTCASCLCLSGDRMAAMASTKPIRPAPTSLKATVWQHFQFHEVKGRIDKTHTVCKVFGTQLKDFGNTTNLRNHLAWHHSELGEKQRPVADASQRKRAGGGTATTELWESGADYQIHYKFYCIWFKTV